ncbi:uncharacterized protein SAPINGB_P001958 [Magnusiomyces paraingens]|uniref:Ribosome biogenesis protein YTM1 n=1 Tax=Magnusiomyces paraingens TaxID=2606893 RepID=A0A5E8BCL9_9ASCO|nr:uncharacterized protein SAPINGB_P001958 [Saprochaete ingens]VVT48801.1 unnamed protein product [Saprochaete ingens]
MTTEEDAQQISSTAQVQIRLVTRDERYAVPSVPLYVPVSLKRYGLSEVVNKLLEQGHEDRVAESSLLPGETETEGYQTTPFDFLTDDGKLLRATLAEYLSQRGLSAESSVTLEYTRAILPPSFLASYAHPDWVSAVSIAPETVANTKVSAHAPIASGSYDGIIRLWTAAGSVAHSLVAHNAAIKAVRWTSASSLVSASNDRMLCLWKLKPESNTNDNDDNTVNTITAASSIDALLRGHTDAVNNVSVAPSTLASGAPARGDILSASSDHTVRLWSSDYSTLPVYEAPESASASAKNTASQKRRKLAQASLPAARSRAPLLTLAAHTAPVTAAIFHPAPGHANSVAYSVSLDHTLKTWDLTGAGAVVVSRTTSFPLTCLAALPDLGLLAIGSSARHILLHDPRSGNDAGAGGDSGDAALSKATLTGHTNFVTSIAPSPYSNYVFASSSMDGTVRVWDARAQSSLYVLPRESGQKGLGGVAGVFDVDWAKSIGIVSGGKDNQLQINSSGFTN